MATIQYLSHSAFLIKEDENTILIDPFITGNPNNVVKLEDLNPNYIVLTHAHGDHLGDAIDISRRNNALIICVNELGVYLSELGINNHKMHIGGAYNFPFGRLKFTIAHHGSSTNDGRYMGEPAGVVIQLKNKTIYHCGDTGLFLDMKLIGELNKIDIMLVPIGDNFTMGIDDAVIAVDFVNPELAIPMHYNTFPIIAADPFEFKSKCETINKKVKVLQFGEVLELN
jgi:L-ascorbate metabolism protein UlaG (beta-lactamase superfamily)